MDVQLLVRGGQSRLAVLNMFAGAILPEVLVFALPLSSYITVF